MKLFLATFFYILSTLCIGQVEKVKLAGIYSSRDSIQIVNAYLKANQAVDHMNNAMNSIWDVCKEEDSTKNDLRKLRWREEEAFMTWMGQPEKIRMTRRKIRKTSTRFERNITLVVSKENKGKCKGWISAWAIPFGKIRITLCEDFFVYRTHLQEKVLVHEIGHEAGMFFHHRIHGCRAARRAASSSKNNIAKRSPENYAWLAMSYLGLECPR